MWKTFYQRHYKRHCLHTVFTYHDTCSSDTMCVQVYIKFVLISAIDSITSHYLVHIRANFCAHFSSFNYYFSFLHLKNQLKCLSWIQAIIKHWPNSTTNLLKKYFCIMKKNWKYFYSSMHSIYVKETTGCWLNYQPYKAHFSCDLQFIIEFPLCYFGSELIWISKETIPCNIWTKHPFWVVMKKYFLAAWETWHIMNDMLAPEYEF